MKKERICALVLLLALLLTACAKAPVEAPEEETPGVGVCLRQAADASTKEYRQLLEAGLTEKGYTVSVTDAGNDQKKQTAQLREQLEAGCDLVIVEPVDPSAAGDIAALLRQAEVPGVLINFEPDAAALESWDRICFVGSDNTQPGLMQSQIILDQPDRGDINDDGVVSFVVLQGPEDDPIARVRTEYCGKGLTFAGVETDPLVQNVGDWTRESGKQLCARSIATYGVDIEVIFCNNDDMAMGAMEALEESGWTVGEDLYLVGINGAEETLRLVAQGRLTGTVLRDIPGQVRAVLQAVGKLLAGQRVEKLYFVDYIKITAQNVENFIK